MKSITRIIGVAVLAMAMNATAAQTTLTGVLTDNMCTKKHMMRGRSDADCVRECVRSGAKYTLVSEGKKHELKGDARMLDLFAGEVVTVSGTQSGGAIAVTAIKKARN